MNDFVEENEKIEIPILYISPEVERMQKERIAEVSAQRSAIEVEQSLSRLKDAAQGGNNLMPHFIECTRAYVTLGEMCSTLAEVFGVHEETAVF